MKRSLLPLALFALWTCASAVALDPKVMTVAVQKTQVRASSGYLSPILGVLSYGEKVTVLVQPKDAPKDWIFVLAPDGSTQGWVNLTALTVRQVDLKTGGSAARQTASSGDVALAGKGFSSVEDEFRSGGSYDYAWVDRMETFTVPPEEIADFVDEGGLVVSGGAR